MKASRRVTAIASALLLGCLAGVVASLRQVDRLRPAATLQEVLYVPSPKVIKRLSLGYDGLLANIYWTRAVQYFGSKHHAGTENYDLLAPLLDIATTLDPKLTVAYEFGANFLAAQPPNGAGQPRAAVELTESGIKRNPNEWRLYYNLGFIYYMELKNYGAAADAFVRGANLPGAHPWLRLLAARMAGHAGDVETARLLWSATYETTQDRQIKANAAAHLRALKVDQDITNLEGLVTQYKQRTGRFPANFKEMIAAGLMGGIPVDPLGYPYELQPDGRIEVRSPDDLPFITRGFAPGYVPPQIPKLKPE